MSVRCGLRSLFWLAAASAVAAPAMGATFNKLVDTTFVAPDGAAVFTLSQPQLAGGTVVFEAATGTPNAYIFSIQRAGGTPVDLVDYTTKVPGGVGNFTGDQYGYFGAFQAPGCTPPVAGTTHAVFVGHYVVDIKGVETGVEGLYSVPLKGGRVVKLADYNTPIPGGPVGGYTKFNGNYSFCNISVSDNTVVFDVGGGGGVYSVKTNGTQLVRVADDNTPATFPPFQIRAYHQPSISGTRVSYIGDTVFGPYGVFLGPHNALGTPVAVATTKPPFNGFSYPIIAGADIIYTADLKSPNLGLLRVTADGGASKKLIDLNTKVPARMPGSSFIEVGSLDSYDGYAPAGAGGILHAETTDGTKDYQGLFSVCKGKLTTLLADGDMPLGVAVGPLGGVSNLVSSQSAGATEETGAILVGGSRYQAIYTVTVPRC